MGCRRAATGVGARRVSADGAARNSNRSRGLLQLWKIIVWGGVALVLLIVLITITGTLGRAAMTLGFLLATTLAMVAAVPVADALRTGSFSFAGRAADRIKSPQGYWSNIGSFSTLGLVMLILASWSGALLIELVVGPPQR